jgi:hypothetical protein
MAAADRPTQEFYQTGRQIPGDSSLPTFNLFMMKLRTNEVQKMCILPFSRNETLSNDKGSNRQKCNSTSSSVLCWRKSGSYVTLGEEQSLTAGKNVLK